MKRIHFEQIPSTHLFAKQHLESLKEFHLTAITADYQTSGIGRRGTSWIAPPLTCLLVTFVYKAPPREQIPLISIKASNALKQSLNLPTTIKYPNDLMVGGKKLAGIISEILNGMAITSVGLNLLQTEEQLRLVDQPATSYFLETGKNLPVEEILNTFWTNFSA